MNYLYNLKRPSSNNNNELHETYFLYYYGILEFVSQEVSMPLILPRLVIISLNINNRIEIQSTFCGMWIIMLNKSRAANVNHLISGFWGPCYSNSPRPPSKTKHQHIGTTRFSFQGFQLALHCWSLWILPGSLSLSPSFLLSLSLKS